MLSAVYILIWPVCTFIITTAMIRWHLPRLYQYQKLKSEKQTVHGLFFAFICFLIAVPCGLSAFETADNQISLIRLLIAFIILSCTAVIDRELMIIPNVYVLWMIIGRFFCFLAELIFFRGDAIIRLVSSFAGAAVCGLGLLLIYVLTRGGIGYGDIKLFIGLGFLCGIYAVINTLIFSCLICGGYSILLLVTRKKGIKDTLPMGPFIFLGYAVTILLGAY